MKLNSKFILLISFYEEPNEKRTSEMFECLEINQKIFHKIIIVYELPNNHSNTNVLKRIIKIKGENESSKNAKIEIEFIGERPSYSDFFRISSKYDSNDNNSWFCIANSDIYFDKTLYCLNDIYIKEEFIIALSRYDKFENLKKDEIDAIPDSFTISRGNNEKWKLISAKKQNKLLNAIPNTFSQDTWIYKKKPINWEKYTFKIGTFFCDSFFNTQAMLDKTNIYNPCLTIRTYHNHNASEDDQNRNKNFNQENHSKFWGNGLDHFKNEVRIDKDHNLYQNKNGLYRNGKDGVPYEIHLDKKTNRVFLRKYHYPVSGVLWSNIEELNNCLKTHIMDWNDHSVFINFRKQNSLYLSLITLEIIYNKIEEYTYKNINYSSDYIRFKNNKSMNLIINFHYDNLNNKINNLLIRFVENLVKDSKINFFAISNIKKNPISNFEYINFQNLKKLNKSESEIKNIIEEKIFNIMKKDKVLLLDDYSTKIMKKFNYKDSENFIIKIEKEIIKKLINRINNEELAKRLVDSEKRLIGI